MSDRVAKLDPDNDGTAGQSMNHYQAGWMDHWKHTSHKPSTEVHNHLLHCHEQKKDDHRDSKQHPLLSGPEMATNNLKYAQEFREVSEARTVDTMKKSLKTGSMKLGKEILDGQPLPMFTNSGNRESAMFSKNNVGTSSTVEPVKYQIDLNNSHNSITMGRCEWVYPEMEYPSGECKFQPEGISRVPEQLVKSHEFREENSLAVSASFQDYVGSSSKIVPYVVNSGVAPTQSFTCQHEIIDQSSPVVASKEHFTNAKFCSYSNFWVREKKADALLESRKLESSLSRQNDAPLLLHDQSTNNGQLRSFLNKQSQKVETNSSIRLLPSLGCPEAMKSEKAYDERFLLPSIPCSVDDVKTRRISTTIDSVEELPRGLSKFSQTAHQFFITKKTGVNLTEGGQVFRDAMVSPKLKGNMFNEFLSLSPSFCFHGQQGVKLQPLESSTDSERKDNVGDVRTSTVCLKNESSVETDSMELNVFQKSHLSSVALCPSDQNIKGVHNSSLSETETATGEEAGNKMANTKLPDMNEGLPALPAVANSIDNGGTSTSRTQSLDAEHLLCQAEQPSDSNATPCPDDLGPELSSRWVKRLKFTTSDPFAHGTKNSKMGEVSSHEKVNNMFSKIMNCSKTSSEPTVHRSHARLQNKMANTKLPDMNEGLPALPAVANSIDDGGTSTSRTQSLDAEHLLGQAEQPSDSNATPCPDDLLGPELSSRWVKRLKLSTSDPFAHGTKSSKMGEVSSREKVNKMFSKIMNCSKTSSEPTVHRSHARPQLALDQTAMLLKNGDSTSSDSVRKSQETSLSRSWIHRWCRHRAASPNKKPDAVVLCEPQSSKATLDEHQKKQFPSIAAMALMGKAMNGFHPCEFRRKGSSIVWST